MTTSREDLQIGHDLFKKAKTEELKRNYEEAIELYEQAVKHFISRKFVAKKERNREEVRAQCRKYLIRAKELKEYVENTTKQQRLSKTTFEEYIKNRNEKNRLNKTYIINTELKAMDIFKKASLQAYNRKYVEAVRLYQLGIEYYVGVERVIAQRQSDFSERCLKIIRARLQANLATAVKLTEILKRRRSRRTYKDMRQRA